MIFVVAAGLVVAVAGAGLALGRIHVGGSAAETSPQAGDESPVTPMNRSFGASNNSPLMVADPSEPRFVVLAHRVDFPDFGCGLELSGDGGREWAPADPVPHLPEGAEKCYAPEIAFDGQGRLYFLFVGLAGSGNRPMGAFLTSSSDRGRTFSEPRPVLGPLNFAVRMAIDRGTGPRGRIHLVWLHAGSDVGLGSFGPPPNPIMAAYSDDGGATFSPPVQASDPSRQRVVAPAIALGPSHTVHVVYYDLGDDAIDYQGLEGPTWNRPWSVVVATSVDGGRRFSTGKVVDDSVAPPERVMLIFTMAPPALAASGSRVCVAWTDARSGDADVVSRCSGDGGRRWAPVRRVNDDHVGNGRSQYLPRLSIAPGGRLDVVFFDRRDDPGNKLNNTYYAYSTDGGRTFAHNLRLSQDPSNSQVGPQYAGAAAEGQWDLGSRLGLLSARRSVVAAWPDTRNTRSHESDQDVVSTAIGGVPAGPTAQPAWARLLGVLLLLGGLVVVGTALDRNRASGRHATGAAPTEAARHEPGFTGEAPVNRRDPGRHLVALSIGILAMASCYTAPRPVGHGPLPAPPTVVDVTMTEYRFDYTPPRNSGRVVFRVVNRGGELHSLDFYPLAEDIPPIDEQLHGQVRRFIDPFARLNPLSPGKKRSFAVDLQPGARYAFICFFRGADNQPHALKGMNSEFRVAKAG